MADKLNVSFQDGREAFAADLNAIVTVVNQLVTENTGIKATLDRISKSELMVLATKSTQQNFIGNGNAITLNGWIAQLNKDSIFNPATGVTTIKEAKNYTIIFKTLISADNAASPRSKASIIAGGSEVGISEDTTFQEITTVVQNYRNTQACEATVFLNPNAVILPNVAVWGSTSARVFGDVNTQLKIYREV
ncbi:hypothetical protein [Chroococcidiopsis sp.]|uniref:hypothetical protein n=1 Tax=Chroococcidiopsis sp. TaxID=3088168 RepID=UPI003F3DA863